ncbi:oxidoreductase family protein [Streptomyces sp. 846.5]|nr:Gfo/Idh/MocA family oxidoreductase [Streptomyces sp. 846.5]TDT97874.1 oxidoreductase family protein [Streptomyces sp. 846.5]
MTHHASLGVAVIGAGRMGADHVGRISEVTSGARVAAVVDVDIDRAKTVAADVDGCAAYGDVAEALASPDVDAVLLASPGVAHEAALLTAFEHDLPVLCEKPLINDSVTHEMDITRWLLGQEITSITVMRPRPSGSAPEGLADPQFVVFETDGGALVDVEIYVNARYGYQVQAEAVCEHGTARIGDRHDMLVQSGGRWGGTVTPGFVERFAEAYDREVQEWVDATRRGEVTGPSAWDGYAVAAVCEAGVRSLSEGCRVEVELADRSTFYS